MLDSSSHWKRIFELKILYAILLLCHFIQCQIMLHPNIKIIDGLKIQTVNNNFKNLNIHSWNLGLKILPIM